MVQVICEVVAGLILAGGVASELKVEVAQAAAAMASPEFQVGEIPAPSRTDAATTALVSVIAGRVAGDSGGTDALIDGQVPSGDDQPGENFFFRGGTSGGRILFDLGEATDVREVRSYSWHTDERSPQVYRLYGDEGKSELRTPRRREEMNAAGWTLLADIDSRDEARPPGGQVAVRVCGRDDSGVGTHRRLIFEVAPTETDDGFGQTFFSEIDIVDGMEHHPRPRAAAIVSFGDRVITFDTTEVPEIREWVGSRLLPVCVEWYPKIVAMFPSDGFTAPREFTVTFHGNMEGVAYCDGVGIHCAGRWFLQNLDGEAAGAVVHEMVHMVQQYGRTRGGRDNPGWLVEGVADYVRWFLYEAPENRSQPDPDRAKYTDSYRVTGAFLAWVADRHGPETIKTLNTAMREGEYSAHLWERSTGRTLDELWEDYVSTLRK